MTHTPAQITNIPYPIPRTLQQKIIDATLLYYQITWPDLNLREHKEKRKIIMYLLRKESFTKIKELQKLFEYKSDSWIRDMVEEIESVKKIYRHISTDINNIMSIVNTLV